MPRYVEATPTLDWQLTEVALVSGHKLELSGSKRQADAGWLASRQAASRAKYTHHIEGE